MEKRIWFGAVVKVYKLKREGKQTPPAVFIVHGKMLQVIIKYRKDLTLHDTHKCTHKYIIYYIQKGGKDVVNCLVDTVFYFR